MVLDKRELKSKMPLNKYHLIIALEMALSVFIFSHLLIQRYYSFAFCEDLGETIQAIHTTAFHGLLLHEAFSSLFIQFNESRMVSYLTIHFSPVLLLLVPIYYLLPRTETILILKSIVTALSAIPAYLLARRHLGDKVATLTTSIYLLNPSLHASTLANWPPVTFLPLFLLLTVYLFETKSKLFWPLLALTLAVHEFAGLLLATYFLIDYVIGKRARARLYLAVITIAFAWSISAFSICNALCPRAGIYTLSLSEMMSRLISPTFILQGAFLVTYALAPFGFLPLRSWYIFSLLPYIAWGISFKYLDITSIGWHHGFYYLPFLYTAFIDSLKKKSSKEKLNKKPLIVSILSLTLLTPLSPFASHFLGPMGIAYSQSPYDEEHLRAIDEILSLVPQDAVIVAQTPIAIRLANRLHTYIYMPKGIDPDFIVMDFTHPLFKTHKFDIVMNEALRRGYGVYALADGVLLLKANYTGDPLFLKPLRSVTTSASPKTYWSWVVTSSSAVYDPASSSKFAACGKSDFAWFGPYMPLAPGTYEVTYRIKIEGNYGKEELLAVLDVVDVASRALFKVIPVYGGDVPRVGEYFNVTSKFSLDSFYTDVGFRGLVVREGITLYLDYIIIRQLDFAVHPLKLLLPPPYFAVEHGTNAGSFLIHEPVHGEGTFWFGPYIRLPPGKYRVIFLLRLDSALTDHIIDLDVACNLGKVVLNKTSLYKNNFTLGVWSSRTLTFSLRETVYDLEFRGVNVKRDVYLSLMLVELIQVGNEEASATDVLA